MTCGEFLRDCGRGSLPCCPLLKAVHRVKAETRDCRGDGHRCCWCLAASLPVGFGAWEWRVNTANFWLVGFGACWLRCLLALVPGGFGAWWLRCLCGFGAWWLRCLGETCDSWRYPGGAGGGARCEVNCGVGRQRSWWPQVGWASGWAWAWAGHPDRWPPATHWICNCIPSRCCQIH